GEPGPAKLATPPAMGIVKPSVPVRWRAARQQPAISCASASSMRPAREVSQNRGSRPGSSASRVPVTLAVSTAGLLVTARSLGAARRRPSLSTRVTSTRLASGTSEVLPAAGVRIRRRPPHTNMRDGAMAISPPATIPKVRTVMTSPARPPAVTVEWYAGDRDALRPLFELAEDSAAELDSYLHSGRVLVARSGPQVLGHLQLVDLGQPGQAEVKNMAVREDQQGQGLGRRLIQAALSLLAAEGVTTVRVATAAADIGNLRFYQR